LRPPEKRLMGWERKVEIIIRKIGFLNNQIDFMKSIYSGWQGEGIFVTILAIGCLKIIRAIDIDYKFK
jgi:hypothetical protein